MANIYLIQEETLDNIANQSNALIGKSVAISPATIISDLSEANTEVIEQEALINQITEVLKGKAGGGGEGDYQTGFEAGKQAEYDAFWNAFQTNGTRTAYNYAFYSWHSDCFKPKYDIKPTAANYMFYDCFILNKKAQNLK